MLKPDEWDNRRQLIKTKHSQHMRLNEALTKIRLEKDKLIQTCGEPIITIDVIRKVLKGGFISEEDKIKIETSQDFVQYALDFNQSCYNLEKLVYSTYNNDNYNIEMFRSYLSKQTGEGVLPMNRIKVEDFDKYKAYCINVGNKKQSINKKLKPLFKAVQYAAKNNLIDYRTATSISEGYFDLKDRKYIAEVEDEDINYLSDDQMKELAMLYNEVKYDRTREFLDIFFFSFYACGLRFSDLLTLEWSHIDIKNREISKNLYKGKINHNLPLTDASFEIIQRWKRKKYNERFVFDLLPADFNIEDVAELDKQRKSKNRSLQTSLNELGRKLPTKISFNLSIHTGRYTFATITCLSNGISMESVAKMLGLSDTKMTRHYAKVLDRTIINEMQNIQGKYKGEAI